VSESPRWKASGAQWDALKPLARVHRTGQTSAEAVLWQALRGRNLAGARFRRQHAIGLYIVDFYCSRARLVLEVDGSSHDSSEEQDVIRQRTLEASGLRVLRFTNQQVLDSLDAVIEAIYTALQHSPSPPGGEGARG
jgi:adenine-specific DNA-methyltransferase